MSIVEVDNTDPTAKTVMSGPLPERYTANQTLFFPQLYMLDRYRRVGHLVMMREAQYSQFGHQSRCEVFTRQGHHLLIVPLQKRAFKPLNEVRVDQPKKWAKKFLGHLQTHYGKQPGYRELKGSITDLVDRLLTRPDLTIADVGEDATRWCLEEMGLPVNEPGGLQFHRSEDLIGRRHENPSEWVASLGKSIGAREYLGGGAAMKNYIQTEIFDRESIQLVTQDFSMATHYTGLHGELVTSPMIAALDVFMCGGRQLVLDTLGDPVDL